MKTVRVRIAVAVQGDGMWYASGYHRSADDDNERDALEFIGTEHELEHVVFVEADVPLPEPQPKTVIEGALKGSPCRTPLTSTKR